MSFYQILPLNPTILHLKYSPSVLSEVYKLYKLLCSGLEKLLIGSFKFPSTLSCVTTKVDTASPNLFQLTMIMFIIRKCILLKHKLFILLSLLHKKIHQVLTPVSVMDTFPN